MSFPLCGQICGHKSDPLHDVDRVRRFLSEFERILERYEWVFAERTTDATSEFSADDEVS